ncbi:hypothetical protein SAMN05216412_10320 [Nitrosospira multiformis]|uniref:Uncharacterized protein n=1 Tax=Nitrosospira multiformis TaxID=1231 RepID=A0A1I0BJF0_9PROT|nr:hypothetical protein [Nitrosospira multiformis]SET06379.1 hypothetical protein SAMN05216412_10320 [Nitrosospira multiformis]
MTAGSNASFVPILTVMVGYGNAPFLWLVDDPGRAGSAPIFAMASVGASLFRCQRGYGGNLQTGPSNSTRQRFTQITPDANGWDWAAFHACGLKLARWLKEEVGDTYRIVYEKPCEDPEYQVDERREVLTDGTFVPLPSFRSNR